MTCRQSPLDRGPDWILRSFPQLSATLWRNAWDETIPSHLEDFLKHIFYIYIYIISLENMFWWRFHGDFVWFNGIMMCWGFSWGFCDTGYAGVWIWSMGPQFVAMFIGNMMIDQQSLGNTYPLLMTNSLPWYRWHIEIDGLPIEHGDFPWLC